MSAVTAGRRSPAATWAAGWAFAFAALSFILALATIAGVPVGAEAFGRGIADQAERRDVGLIIAVWLSGDLKAGCGLVALGLMHANRPPRALRFAAWAIGGGLAAYGLFNLIVPALMLAGAVGLPSTLGEVGARWHVAVWGPWWIAGGVLFLAAAAQRPGPVRRSPPT